RALAAGVDGAARGDVATGHAGCELHAGHGPGWPAEILGREREPRDLHAPAAGHVGHERAAVGDEQAADLDVDGPRRGGWPGGRASAARLIAPPASRSTVRAGFPSLSSAMRTRAGVA